MINSKKVEQQEDISDFDSCGIYSHASNFNSNNPAIAVVPMTDQVTTFNNPSGVFRMIITYEDFLIICGLAISSFVGAYIRIGISYYRVGNSESNFCIMYAQIIGSFIMGYVVSHRKFFYDYYSNRFNRAIYIALTTGLCGSITTFSSWQLEANKNFFLQWDFSRTNLYSSYNAGRLLEWMVSLWVGVVLPLSALRTGKYIATLSNYNNEKINLLVSSCNSNPSSPMGTIFEFLLLATFLVSLFLVIFLPVYFYSTSLFFTYTAVFGFIGSYTRYVISNLLNPIRPEFPIGTFSVNVMGTWILAAVTMSSKFAVNYYNTDIQSVLYGITMGYCGCLTTVSTFVNEIDNLSSSFTSPLSAYRYCILSNIIAQFGIILIYNTYLYQTIPIESAFPTLLNICPVTRNLCTQLLTHINCSVTDRKNTVSGSTFCSSATSTEGSWLSSCQCGQAVPWGDSLRRVLVESQLSKSTRSSYVATIWPQIPLSKEDPTAIVDICTTYENACRHFLYRIRCPIASQRVSGCGKKGIVHFQPTCMCTSNNWDCTQEILTVVVETVLTLRYDMIYPIVVGNIGSRGTTDRPIVSICKSDFIFSQIFLSVCRSLLENIECPTSSWQVSRTATSTLYCSCGYSQSLSDSLISIIVDTLVTDVATVGSMSTFEDICSNILNQLSCPLSSQQILGIEFPSPKCLCDKSAFLAFDSDILNSLSKLMLSDYIKSENIEYIPPYVDPYSVAATNSPYKQLS